jgi:hypothetical protein
VGILCGNAITGISISLAHILKVLECVISRCAPPPHRARTILTSDCSEFPNNTKTVPGALDHDSYRQLAVEALRLGLSPTINQMRCVSTRPTLSLAHSQTSFSLVSVMGIIAIPGMMTRAILDGSDVQQAAWLQIVIAFMIAASNALSCIIATLLVLRLCVDSEYRVRGDCIDTRPHVFCRVCSSTIEPIVGIAGRMRILAVGTITHVVQKVKFRNGDHVDSASERTQLLT